MKTKMKKTTLIALTGLALGASSTAFAGSVKTGNDDITIEGGVTAGYFYSGDQAGSNEDNILLSDFMLEVSGGDKTTFAAGLGIANSQTVYGGGAGAAGNTIATNIQYAYLTPTLAKGVTLDLGLLATNIGYEVQQSYANGNILRGAVWNSQPIYYPGIRANVEVAGMNAYVELSDTFPGGAAASKAGAAGVSGAASGMDFALNYRQINNGNGLVNVILSSQVAGMDVGLNFDYITLDSAPTAGADTSAYGLALYVTPKVAGMDIPVRVEYLNDGTSGAYGGVDTGYSFTVTPTMALSKNSFLRVELSYLGTDKLDIDGDGTVGDSAMSAALQGGYLF